MKARARAGVRVRARVRVTARVSVRVIGMRLDHLGRLLHQQHARACRGDNEGTCGSGGGRCLPYGSCLRGDNQVAGRTELAHEALVLGGARGGETDHRRAAQHLERLALLEVPHLEGW